MDHNAELLPIDTVLIHPARQRQQFDEAKLLELQEDIVENGLIHAIAININHAEKTRELIVGERRLRAIRELYEAGIAVEYAGRPVPLGCIPASIYENLTDEQKFNIEFSENVKRQDLTWQEKAKALSQLHAVRKADNPNQTQEATAKEFKEAQGKTTPVTGAERAAVQTSTFVAKHLDDEDVQKAPTQKDALKILKRKLTEQFTNALVRNPAGEKVNTYHKLYALSMDKAPDFIEGIACTIADPPYGADVAGFGSAAQLRHEYSEEDYEGLCKRAVKVISEVSKPDAHAYMFCTIKFFIELKAAWEDAGWRVRPTPLIWSKGPRGHLSDGKPVGYRREYELILYASRGARECIALLSDILHYPADLERIHAAQKPSALYETLIKQSTIPGEKVLDPFAGSGVIFESAGNTETQGYAFELNTVAVSRIEAKHGVFREVLK